QHRLQPGAEEVTALAVEHEAPVAEERARDDEPRLPDVDERIGQSERERNERALEQDGQVLGPAGAERKADAAPGGTAHAIAAAADDRDGDEQTDARRHRQVEDQVEHARLERGRSQRPPGEDRDPDRNERDGPDRERALDPSDEELSAGSVVDQRLAGEFDGAPHVPARAGSRPRLIDAQRDDGAEQVADREHEEIGATAPTDDAPSGGGHDTPPAWIAAPAETTSLWRFRCATDGRRAGGGGAGGGPGKRQHGELAGPA